MFNSFLLRYRVRLDGIDEFLTVEALGHYRTFNHLRDELKDFCPVIYQDPKVQERVRFSLLQVRLDERGPYWDV